MFSHIIHCGAGISDNVKWLQVVNNRELDVSLVKFMLRVDSVEIIWVLKLRCVLLLNVM